MRALSRIGFFATLALTALAQDGTPVRVTENVHVKKMVQAIYPLRSQQEQIQGRVVLDVTVDRKGKVTNIDVLSGNDVLAAAFKDAVKHWEFEPQKVNGEAIPFITSVGMNFALHGNVLKNEPAAPPPQAALPAPSSAPAGKDDPNSAASSAVPPTDKVRISSGVAKGNLIYKVQPVYPRKAIDGHIQGTVILRAIIGKDGIIHNLQVISGPEELKDAALGAVEQWKYRPYMLEGNPVEVETTIQVNFQFR
jgi:TonB family protein